MVTRARVSRWICARDADAVHLPLEAERFLRQTRRNERTAHGARAVAAGDLADVDPELGEHTADATRLEVVALLERAQCYGLALLDAIERGLQAGDHPTDAACVLDGEAGARIDRRIEVDRQEEGALVAERGGLERRRSAGGQLDRSGDVATAEAAERAGARLQRRLPAQDLVELLLVLLLVKQLAAGDAVDLGARLGDAILVAELHVGLSGDQPGEHVVAEGKIGGGGDGPHRHDHQRAHHHPEGDRAEPQLAPGMNERVSGGPPPGGNTRGRPGMAQPAIDRMAGMTAVMVPC